MKRIGIIATIIALMLLLVSSVYATAPVINPIVPNQTKDEDASAWTLDLTAYETDTGEDSGTDLDWSVSGVDTTLFTAVITNLDEDILTFTPVANKHGSDEITLTLKDSDDEIDTQTIIVTLNSVNDAPVVSVSDCATKTQGVEDIAYICTVSATDEEGNGITLTSSEGTITGTTLTWMPTEDEIGSNTITVTATDNGSPSKEGSASFQVFIRPHRVCGDYEDESDLSINVDITDDDEDFYPGDEIEIEVDVENEADDEINNIIVEAILYDTTDGKRLSTVESNDFDLDENDEKTVDLTLEVPEDIDTDNKMIVFVSAYEDGNDDDNCDWEYNSGLDFKRRTHDLVVNQVTLTPETVKAGKTVEAKIEVENVGDRDEENVYIKIKNSELRIDKKSEIFNIEEYQKDDDDEYTATVTFTVPADAKSGKYDLEVNVYDKYHQLYESGSAFATLIVEATTIVTQPSTTGTATITIEGTPEKIEPGKAVSIPVKVTNTASENKEYKIMFNNIADWAESTSVIDAYLTPGQTSTYYLTIIPKTDATEGQHSATVNIKEGTTTITTKTLSFTIPETSKTDITGGTVADVNPDDKGVFYNIFGGTTFWIIGDLVLVIVGIFFIRMLFSKKEE